MVISMSFPCNFNVIQRSCLHIIQTRTFGICSIPFLCVKQTSLSQNIRPKAIRDNYKSFEVISNPLQCLFRYYNCMINMYP